MIVFFKYSNAESIIKEFYGKLNTYGNLKLLERIQFVLEEHSETDELGYSSLFPEFYYARFGKSLCLERIKCLKMMVDSEIPYYNLPPSLAFILSCILQYADRRAQDLLDEEDIVLFEEQFYKPGKGQHLQENEERTNKISELSNQLDSISAKSDDESLRSDYEAFKEFYWEYVYPLFDDGGDYTPEGLELLVAKYMRFGGEDVGIIDGINLYDCVDNMFEHTRLLFESVQREDERKRKLGFDSLEEYIISSLQYCIARLQTKITYIENDNEVRISDRIADMLSGCLYEKCVLVDREVPMGRALKELGKTDILLSYYDGVVKNHLPIAIIENKTIENFTAQYYQLMGYLNQDFCFGVTISINRNKRLNEAVDYIYSSIKAIDGPFKVKSLSELTRSVFTLKSTHIIPETNREMDVYHFVLNLNDEDRKESALRARKNTRRRSEKRHTVK